MTEAEKIKEWVREIFALPSFLEVDLREPEGRCTEIRIMLKDETKSVFTIESPVRDIARDNILALKDSMEESVNSSFVSRNMYRFFGWWMIFAGSFTLFSVCPICGQAGCIGSIGFTAVASALLALLKNSSTLIKGMFRKK